MCYSPDSFRYTARAWSKGLHPNFCDPSSLPMGSANRSTNMPPNEAITLRCRTTSCSCGTTRLSKFPMWSCSHRTASPPPSDPSLLLRTRTDDHSMMRLFLPRRLLNATPPKAPLNNRDRRLSAPRLVLLFPGSGPWSNPHQGPWQEGVLPLLFHYPKIIDKLPKGSLHSNDCYYLRLYNRMLYFERLLLRLTYRLQRCPN